MCCHQKRTNSPQVATAVPTSRPCYGGRPAEAQRRDKTQQLDECAQSVLAHSQARDRMIAASPKVSFSAALQPGMLLLLRPAPGNRRQIRTLLGPQTTPVPSCDPRILRFQQPIPVVDLDRPLSAHSLRSSRECHQAVGSSDMPQAPSAGRHVRALGAVSPIIIVRAGCGLIFRGLDVEVANQARPPFRIA